MCACPLMRVAPLQSHHICKEELDKANNDKKHFPPGLQTFLPRLLSGQSLTKGRITTDRSWKAPHTHAHTLFTPFPPTKQVHVTLSEAASNEVNVDDDVALVFWGWGGFVRHRQWGGVGNIHLNLSECCRCVGEWVCVGVVRIVSEHERRFSGVLFS